MSMHMLNCPTCLVEKPTSCKHVRKIEIVESTGQKYFTCNQCHKDYAVVEEDARHVVIGTELKIK